MKIKNIFPHLMPIIACLLMIGCSKKNSDTVKNDSAPSEHSDDDHHNTHDHGDHMAHMGVMAILMQGDKKVGIVELKLHDDKGDLELWLTRDKGGALPLDFDLSTVVNVSFPELNNKSVELRIRDDKTNEDENGKANIRENKTNYFIFPGNTGVDASFLSKKDFSSQVILSFFSKGTEYKTAPFELIPHTHSH